MRLMEFGSGRRVVVGASVAAIVTGVGAWSAAPGLSAAPPQSSADPQTVCNVYHQPVSRPGEERSPMAPPQTRFGGCFASAAAARAGAEEAAPRRRVLIGVDTAGPFRDPEPFLRHYGDGGACTMNTKYKSRWIGKEWNDRVSTAGGAHRCNRFVHFKDSGFGGGRIVCGLGSGPPQPNPGGWCITMSALFDDETSSEKWNYGPNRDD